MMSQEQIKFIAFGAGQCSSVLPFILDDYDLIIFANTGWELPLTYEWIKIIKKSFKKKFIQVDTNMPDDINHHPPICTKKFKVEPIRRYLRSIGVKQAVKYLGMTVEEKRRVHPNNIKWIAHEYPLIKLGWTRKKCQQYLLDNFGFVPPRSGCTICKYFDRDHLVTGIKKKMVLESWILKGKRAPEPIDGNRFIDPEFKELLEAPEPEKEVEK